MANDTKGLVKDQLNKEMESILLNAGVPASKVCGVIEGMELRILSTAVLDSAAELLEPENVHNYLDEMAALLGVSFAQ